MSKSALLSSSIAKKWWMALTGLFLCTFLIGHLLGNLQLIMQTGEEGRRAFNEYAYFMGHNIFIKVLSYLTYFSILFHVVDGFMLTFQNKKARPVNYTYNKPGTNSKLPARYMAILGTVILVFIVTHMANFWYKMKISGEPMAIHMIEKPVDLTVGQNPMTGEPMMKTIDITYVLTTKGEYKEYQYSDAETGEKQKVFEIENGTDFVDASSKLKIGEGYKDLHSVVMSFFGQDKTKELGVGPNEYALIAVICYVLAMLVLAFHLFHGFASAFQSLGVNHKRYNPIIKFVGIAFSIVVPLAFAVIPVLIYMWK